MAWWTHVNAQSYGPDLLIWATSKRYSAAFTWAKAGGGLDMSWRVLHLSRHALPFSSSNANRVWTMAGSSRQTILLSLGARRSKMWKSSAGFQRWDRMARARTHVLSEVEVNPWQARQGLQSLSIWRAWWKQERGEENKEHGPLLGWMRRSSSVG
ncbi:hypothetical protein LZ30DRAFT_49120 [Colletotrichum cereale]|nr:hypothetical protein LZ30DRAFT_49120 [Colletotrichum cereale]